VVLLTKRFWSLQQRGLFRTHTEFPFKNNVFECIIHQIKYKGTAKIGFFMLFIFWALAVLYVPTPGARS